MDEKLFFKISNYISNINKVERVLDFKTYKDYIDGLHINMQNYNASQPENKDIIDLVEIIALYWGLFSLSYVEKSDESDCQLSMELFALTTQISNNLITMVQLSCNGMDYQFGVLMRSTIELCLTILVIIADKGKREKYFLNINPTEKFGIWDTEFKFSKLRDAMKEYNCSSDSDSWEFVKRWLSKKYEFYSDYVHNNFIVCYICSFTRAKDGDYNSGMNYNLWGSSATRVNRDMNDLCEFMYFISLGMLKEFTKDEYYENLILDNECKKFWNDAIFLMMVFKTRYEQLALIENGHEDPLKNINFIIIYKLLKEKGISVDEFIKFLHINGSKIKETLNN